MTFRNALQICILAQGFVISSSKHHLTTVNSWRLSLKAKRIFERISRKGSIDFSVLGSFVISFIAGFLSQLAFNRVRSGSWVAMVPLSMFYAFTLYSPLISIFHYNSVIVSWVFAFLIFSYMKYKNYEILAYYS